MRRSLLPLLMASSLALGGCVASIAASAVGAVVSAASGGGEEQRVIVADLRPGAIEACRARAASLGEVRIIDSDQREDGRVTVWGAIEGPQGRRSFECIHRGGQIRAFEQREIRTPQASSSMSQ